MLLALLLILSCTTFTMAAGNVKIGQATCGEGGKLRECSAGDQSGGEVSISNWSYGKGAFHWTYVFRAKDKNVAKQIAANMQAAAANNNIGYDQASPDRNTFFDEAKKTNWDISKIRTKCETTCSSAVSVCLNAAGVKVPRKWYTGAVYEDIMATGMFDCYTAKEYVASDRNLLPGDILCSESHTAMVVESPNKFPVVVTYETSQGLESKTFSEDSTIYLNLGNTMQNLTLVDDVTLDPPEREYFTFDGWSFQNDIFTAKYQSRSMPIKVDNKIKKLN